MSKPRYIAHTSGKQPVGNNQFVDIVFSNGSVNETQRAGGQRLDLLQIGGKERSWLG